MDIKASQNPFEALGEDSEEEVIIQISPIKKTTEKKPEEKKVEHESPTEEQLEIQKYAAEKLRRQNERITQSEAALEDIMKSKSAGRTSRANKWKPFDFREVREESPFRDDEISARSTPTPFDVHAKVFQPTPLPGSRNDPQFSHLVKMNTNVAASQELQWTAVRPKMASFSAYQNKDENHIPKMTTTYSKRDVNEVFGNDLPSPSYCSTHAGSKNGQVQFCVHPNGDVSAQQWSESHYQWVNIGQYSATRRKTEGQLATSRVKGETEILALQQNTLAYFHAVAKQREAEVMGIAFGPKDVQACMPNLNLRRASATETAQPPANAPTAPAAHYKTAIKPGIALPKQKNESRLTSPDLDTSTAAASPIERLQRKGEYLQQLVDTQGRFGSLTFGSMPYTSTPEFSATDHHGTVPKDYHGVVLPQHPGTVPAYVKTYPHSFEATGSGTGQAINTYPSLSSSRHSAGASQGLNAAVPMNADAYEEHLGFTRPSIRDAFTKLYDQSSSRSSYSGDKMVMQEPEKGEQPIPLGQHTYRQSVLQAYHQLHQQQQFQEAEPLMYTRTPGKLPTTQGLPRGSSFTGSLRDLATDSEPDDYYPPSSQRTYQLHHNEAYLLTEPPTPQHLDNNSIHSTPAHSTIPGTDLPYLTDYDRNLKSWFFNRINFERQQEFYNEIMSSSANNTPTRRSKSRAAGTPGVIGPPPVSLASQNTSSSSMERHDSSLGTSASPPSATANTTEEAKAKAEPEQKKEDTTRMLIPMLDNLRDYVQGPMSKRRGHWAPFVPPPEWAVDKGMNGNLSFFEDDWGKVPERIGRDRRYRELVHVGGGVFDLSKLQPLPAGRILGGRAQGRVGRRRGSGF
ncbi:hypothetical protein B9Z65_7778 [Elsinoe australis]|uniref:Uncharacterized protein n=1 Tax=Elsinoe australis TaxID=40998 RepID=A0A2P8A0H7_9PEZI|nr:hypothetical protein B9Z65_7778 [Elsinoe australis]